MHRRTSTKVSLALILAIVACSVTPAIAETSPSIEIAGIYDTASEEKAMLEIKFLNSSQTSITIPFFGIVKKATYNELSRFVQQKTKASLFQCSINGKKLDDFFLGEFATVSYSWQRTTGNGSNYSDVYTLSANSIELQGGQTKTIVIPIRVPKTDGDYTLSVTFDNSSVTIPTKAAANRLLSTNYQLFKRSTSASVSLDVGSLEK
jgi:hypothetical protein